jgi:hypothetical protein
LRHVLSSYPQLMGTCFGRPAMQSIARLEQWRRVVIAEVVLPFQHPHLTFEQSNMAARF